LLELERASKISLLSPAVNDCLQLPDKSMADIVKYYYRWKRGRGKASLMDRQAKQAPLSDLLTDISEDSDRYGVPISLPYVLVFYVIISHQCQKNK